MSDDTNGRHQDRFTLGEHDARIDVLEQDMRELRADMREVLTVLHEAKGGWKTLMLVGGMAGAVGALLGKFFPFFFGK